MTPHVLLYDDATARGWQPFALTRPAGEMRYGAFTLRERAERLCGAPVSGHLSSPHLEGFSEPGAATVLASAALPSGPLLLLSARAVIDWKAGKALMDAVARHSVGDGVTRLLVDGEPVGLIGDSRFAAELRERCADGSPPDPAGWSAGAEVTLPGVVLRHVWEFVSGMPDQVGRDIEAVAAQADASLPDGVYVRGDHGLVIEDGVDIEPGVVFDTSDGPIWLRSGAAVRAFTRLAGPAVVDGTATLFGGSFEAVSIGPVVRARGEVGETVIFGYSNKMHDGFLGHACLGRWVNLGALTTNSDLKNNYGPVRIDTGAGEVDTGETKLGCFLGDHVKTGIGMMLNTGTVIGAGSMLYGSTMPPKYVPPFMWGTGEERVSYRVDKFLETARTVMQRRGVDLDDANEQVLRRAWQLSEPMRATAK